MTSVLDQIARAVTLRLEGRKTFRSQDELLDLCKRARKPHDFRAAFSGPGTHIISEIKFASPSQGTLSQPVSPVEVARKYLANGATALSILTEQDYFHGKLEYLTQVRGVFPEARLLLKDFVVDEYQLLEARVSGADAALLIVALLGEGRCSELLSKCGELGLTALVEVHNREELEIAQRIGAKLIGVNNRNLKTLEISLDTSFELANSGNSNSLLISESGLSHGDELRSLRKAGYSGFLIGTTFMKTGDPGAALAKIIREAQ